jgi:hypothetical protein
MAMNMSNKIAIAAPIVMRYICYVAIVVVIFALLRNPPPDPCGEQMKQILENACLHDNLAACQEQALFDQVCKDNGK